MRGVVRKRDKEEKRGRNRRRMGGLVKKKMM